MNELDKKQAIVQNQQTENQAELLNSKAGTQRRLSPAMENAMEERFGYSMAGITFKESPEVREAGARAYAKGNMIRFAPGQFDEHSAGGREIIEHEISHVIQQSQGKVRPDGPDSPLSSDPALERQADTPSGLSFGMSSSPAMINTPSFDSAPAQMWPWSKKSSTPKDRRVSKNGFKTSKSAYRDDEDFQNFRKLLTDYNMNGGTADQEIALMEAASGYIMKHSTGEEAKHKGRTAFIEDILFQLAMKGGTKAKADANIERLKDTTHAKKYGTYSAEEMTEKGKNTLSNIQSLYNPKGPYSKPLQMVAAEVMSQQNRTTQYEPSGSSNASRHYETSNSNEENAYYVVNGNMGGNDSYVLGTNFHEFTHVAGEESFDNSDMMLTYEPGTDSEEVLQEMKRRCALMEKLNALSQTDALKDFKIEDSTSLSKYTPTRVDYATGTKTSQQYIPAEFNKLSKTFIDTERSQNPNSNHPERLDDTYLRSVTANSLPGMIEEMEAGTRRGGILDNEQTRNRIKDNYKKLNDFKDIYSPIYDESKRIIAMHESETRIKNLQEELKIFENDPTLMTGNSLKAYEDKKALLERTKSQYEDAKAYFKDKSVPSREEGIALMNSYGTNTMTEYDPVVNQMLSQYEFKNGDKDSQFYRLLKAESINSHVRRRKAALNRQKAATP